MKLVESHGSIYKIPQQEYRSILRSIKEGTGYRIHPSRYQGEVECNLNTLTPSEASELLDLLIAEKPPSRRTPYIRKRPVPNATKEVVVAPSISQVPSQAPSKEEESSC